MCIRDSSYNLKKKHLDLRRNVKFDEQDLGLFMDLQTEREGPWRLVKPEQARKVVPENAGTTERELGLDDIMELLREGEESQ